MQVHFVARENGPERLRDRFVQSDLNRMNWFRTLLAERARSFQIVVFTCRPADYLAAAAMVPEAFTLTLARDSFGPLTSVSGRAPR